MHMTHIGCGGEILSVGMASIPCDHILTQVLRVLVCGTCQASFYPDDPRYFADEIDVEVEAIKA